MSYMALYRKFRPETFADVKGQDAIVRTLKNQIKADRVGHAYLFCGTRGTGKTTVAKIFARAVNCEHPVDGEPCGTCPSCRAIASGSSMNVIEIDAASNNGVDNIRQIREEVSYRPTTGRYKVYIIDEVHMLSIGAFNALLKTLEEPPEYVIFILATTEAQKIPVTILSRCQRYDFKRISVDTIEERLTELIQKEQWDVEEAAIRYLARMADGSMRDALSLLDQCTTYSMGGTLTYDQVLEILGAVDTEVFSRLFRDILSQDVSRAMATVEELVNEGRDLSQLAADFTWYLRNLLLAGTSENLTESLDVSTENRALLMADAKLIDADTLMHDIRVFSDLSGQLKTATQKRVLLEVTLIKLMRPAMESEPDALLSRIRAVERRLDEAEQGTPVRAQDTRQEEIKEPAPAKRKLAKAVGADVRSVAQDFRAIVSETSQPLRDYLKRAKLSPGEGNHLQIVLPDEVSASAVNTAEHLKELTERIENRIGKAVELEVTCVPKGQAFEDQFIDLEQVIHMDITVED